MALQQNDFGRIPRSLSVAQHKIVDKVERMYVRLEKGDVPFDQKSALKLSGWMLMVTHRQRV